MRVICIDAVPVTENGWSSLVEGAVYDVISSLKSHCGQDAYEIDVIGVVTKCSCGSMNAKEVFLKRRFIPLSNIDEKELLEERELQFQNA